MICLVLDQSIANRHANEMTPALSSILSNGNIPMNTPCLLITYHFNSTTVYLKATLQECVQSIANISFSHQSPMMNPLSDAMTLAHSCLSKLDSVQHHIVLLTSSLYFESMDTALELLKSSNMTLSVVCKKGLKPIEDLPKNGWRSLNTDYSIVIDKSFVPEQVQQPLAQQQQQQQAPLSQLKQQQQQPTPLPPNATPNNIPPSVTYGPAVDMHDYNQYQYDTSNYQQPPPQQQPIQDHTTSSLWTGQLQMNEIVAPVVATPISKHDLPLFHCPSWPPTLSIFGLYTVNIHTLQGYVQSNHVPIVSFEDMVSTPQFDAIKRSLQEQRKVAVIKQDQYHGFCIFMNNNRLLGLVMIKIQFPPDILQCLGYTTSPQQQPSQNTPTSTPQQQPQPQQPPIPQQLPPQQQQQPPQQPPQQHVGSPHLYATPMNQPMGSPQIRGMTGMQYQQYRQPMPQQQQQQQYRNMPMYNPYMLQQQQQQQQQGRGMPQFRTPYGMMQYPVGMPQGMPMMPGQQMGNMMPPPQGMNHGIPPNMMQPPQQQQQRPPQQPQQPNMSPGMPQQQQQQQMPNMQLGGYMQQYYQQPGMQPPQYRRPPQ